MGRQNGHKPQPRPVPQEADPFAGPPSTPVARAWIARCLKCEEAPSAFDLPGARVQWATEHAQTSDPADPHINFACWEEVRSQPRGITVEMQPKLIVPPRKLILPDE